jgi:hypothetical protein
MSSSDVQAQLPGKVTWDVSNNAILADIVGPKKSIQSKL